MTKFFFWSYPWDLEEEGIEVAIDRLGGDIGVDAVSVATTLPSISEFRARAFAQRRTVEHDAAAHFRPDATRYVNTRIRPIPSPWMKSRNPLEKIARYADKQGMKVRAWTNPCHGSAMAAKYKTVACIDVFGDINPTWMCPSNPDVREYVASLVEDLATNYPLDTIELDDMDFGSRAHSHKHLHAGVRPGMLETILLSWCFCPSCHQRARDSGVDVEAAAAAVAGHIGQWMLLKAPVHRDLDSLLASDDNLAAYNKMQTEAVTSLVRLARERTKTRLMVHHGTPWASGGVPPRAMEEVADGLIVRAPLPGRTHEPDFRYPYAYLAERTELALLCHPPYVKDGPALVSTVYQAAHTGCAAIGFWNYGIAPEPCLEWVRQAVRYARRESI
ncbi:MAG TPA: hypothetical protein VMV94_16125 [Phycisphaerae bacterium]|nr:hypothetical protein [Phycisphaerae bacterium]